MRKQVGLFAVLTLVFASLMSGGVVGAAGVAVTHASMQNWFFSTDDHPGPSSGEMVNGPAGGLGAGSAHLTVGATNGGQLLATPQFAATRLDAITTLTYQTYTTTANLAPALMFDIDYDLTDANTNYQGRFVFDTTNNGALQAIQTGQWQTWNVLDPNAKWFASRAPGNATCPNGNTCTIAQILALFPNAGIRAGSGILGLKAGSGWASFDGNVDNINVGISGNTTTFDFEVGAGAATLYVRTGGSDVACNGETDADFGASFPNCAFKTVQKAATRARGGDTINVRSGTFTEQVNVTKSLTIAGAGTGSTTIKAPATPAQNIPTPSGTYGYAVVALSSSANVTISGVTVDGPFSPGHACSDDFIGVTVYGGSALNMSNSAVTNITNSDSSLLGCQQGVAVQIGRNSLSQVGTATLDSVTVSNYEKNGITIDGVGTSATVKNSTITSAPTAATATNGIQVSRGATATVQNNTISANACNHPTACGADPINTAQSSGIILYDPAAGVTITGNTLTGNDIGIYNYSPANDGASLSRAVSEKGKGRTAARDAGSTSGPKRTVANNDPTAITGNTLTNNRYEGIFLDEGAAVLTGNTISGGNIGVEVASFSAAVYGTAGDSRGKISGNTISGAAVADIQLQDDDTTDAFIPTISGASNKITGTAGLNNTTGTAVDLTKNWWGSPSGPTNAANPGGAGASVTSNVTFSPWCGNDTCTIFYGIAAKLAFTTQPGGALASAALTPQPVVTAQDVTGNLAINFVGAVTVALGNNPSNAALGGTKTVDAAAGVATFSGLSVDKPGTGYTLVASATNLTSATSAAFSISPPVPTVSAVSPTTGSTLGGNTVTITGTNFIAGDTVTFGGTAATNVTVVNSTTITATAPAHAAGAVAVIVVNANNQGATLAGAYTYATPGAEPGTTGRPSGPVGVVGNPNPAPPGRSSPPNQPPGR